jgi:hypothetical protein
MVSNYMASNTLAPSEGSFWGGGGGDFKKIKIFRKFSVTAAKNDSISNL